MDQHGEPQDDQYESVEVSFEDLQTELEEYKVLAHSLEKRLFNLHKELEKKDVEIARLKNQLTAATAVSPTGVQSTFTTSTAESVLADANTQIGAEELTLLCKMFIGGLSPATTTDSLRTYFSQFGEIVNCIVLKDPATERSRGFGFVQFANPSSVDAAQATRPHAIDGKVVDSKRAVPKGEATKGNTTTKRIFIGGMKTTTSDETLRSYFAQFGEVEHVDVPEDKAKQRKRGFGYVTFSDSDPVDKVTIIHYHVIDGRRCEVKKAFSREEMEAIKGASQVAEVAQEIEPEEVAAEEYPMWAPGVAPEMAAGFIPPQMQVGPYGYMGVPYGAYAPGAVGMSPYAVRQPSMTPAANVLPVANPAVKASKPGPMVAKSSFLQRAAGPYGVGYGPKPAAAPIRATQPAFNPRFRK